MHWSSIRLIDQVFIENVKRNKADDDGDEPKQSQSLKSFADPAQIKHRE